MVRHVGKSSVGILGEGLMRILCGGPVSEDADVFEAHIASLQSQSIPMDYKGIDNSPVPLVPPIGFRSVDWRYEPGYGEYKGKRIRWTKERLRLLSRLREEMRLSALDGEYDYLLMVDSDLVIGPDTLELLLAAEKDFIAGIYWVGDWTNVACFGKVGRRHSSQPTDEEKSLFRAGGIHQVDITGACSLISRAGLQKLSYSERPHVIYEDMCLAFSALESGIPLYVHCDTKINTMRRRG